MDIHSRLFAVSRWDPDHIVDYGLFLEEHALPKNNSSRKSLCCHSSDRRISGYHGDY